MDFIVAMVSSSETRSLWKSWRARARMSGPTLKFPRVLRELYHSRIFWLAWDRAAADPAWLVCVEVAAAPAVIEAPLRFS